MARRIFAFLYTCSGAAGLVYEIVWTRLLSLQLGHTVAAVGTVLAAFMGGLAVGAAIGGRIAPRLTPARALRTYAAIECAIALCAVAFPFALRALVPLFAFGYGDQPGLAFAFTRLAACLILVFVPAAVIGATFPLAIRWFVGDAATAGREAGRLYALNTAGAAVAALATGFLLIPWVGLLGTTAVGIALNGVAAAGAWFLPIALTADRPPRPPKRPPAARRPAVGPHLEHGARRWLPAAVLGLGGFVSLAYEVAFTRVLAIALGPTTYAFAAMLTAFITGLAAGAAVASRRDLQLRAGALALGLSMLAVAAAAAGAGWIAGTRLPLLVAEAVAESGAGASTILARQAFYAVALLLPLSAALGLLFPLGMALTVVDDDRVARDVGMLYAINTTGAVAGSLTAAFVLVPGLGVQQTLRVLGLVTVGAACLTFVAGRLPAPRRVAAIAAAAVAAALVVLVPQWDLNLLSGGAYKYASEVRDLNLDFTTGLKAGTLLYYEEGAASTVSVRQLAGTVAMAIDGKIDASNGTDMLTQKLLAHLPLLLHPKPVRVAIIGLGSGVTAGAALTHGIERVDVVELSPEVVEASAFFAEENGRALQDPRLRLIVADGRTHLQLSSAAYDVIISEPSNPWMAGVASLFTREFFAAARARLAPGGILCQWAHTYDIAEQDLRSIAATFATAFPNGTMWMVGDGDLLFIATNDASGLPLDNIGRAWQRPEVAIDLAKTSVFDPFSALTLYVGGPAELQRYGQGARIQSDDHPALEFSAPLGVYIPKETDNSTALRALLDPARMPPPVHGALAGAGAREWSNRGEMLLKAHAYASAYESFARSLQLDPGHEPALAGLAEAASASERLADARRLLEALASGSHGRTEPRIALARLLAALGEYEQATARAQQVIAAEPGNPRAPELLASILADSGDVARLGPLVARMRQAHPDREETSYYAAMLSFLTGNFPEAIARAERVVEKNPHHALALNLIGSASASLGRHDRAREAFRASLQASPREPSTYANLGLLELESGNRDAAVAYFAESLTLDPHQEVARAYLPAALAGANP